MSMVRRCDNPECVRGAAGTVASSETANPAGWVVVQGEILGAPEAPVNGDFCTIECAAATLLAGRGYEIVPKEA